MDDKQIEKLADCIVAATLQYTDMYCKEFKVDQIDKQLWAALHIGFLAGAKYSEIDDEDIERALGVAQVKLRFLEGMQDKITS